MTLGDTYNLLTLIGTMTGALERLGEALENDADIDDEGRRVALAVVDWASQDPECSGSASVTFGDLRAKLDPEAETTSALDALLIEAEGRMISHSELQAAIEADRR